MRTDRQIPSTTVLEVCVTDGETDKQQKARAESVGTVRVTQIITSRAYITRERGSTANRQGKDDGGISKWPKKTKRGCKKN